MDNSETKSVKADTDSEAATDVESDDARDPASIEPVSEDQSLGKLEELMEQLSEEDLAGYFFGGC